SADGTLRLWDSDPASPTYASEIARFEGDGNFDVAALSPDGKFLAAGDGGGGVHLLEVLHDATDKAVWLERVEHARQQGIVNNLPAGNLTRESRPTAFQRFFRKLLPSRKPDG